MAQKGVAAVVVISDGQPAGIVSAKDFGRRVVLEGRSLEGTKVGDIMTSPVITVGPTTTVSEAMAVMTPNRIRHLPVMDEDRLAGIVAMGDLARAVIAERAFTIDQLHGYVGHKYPV
jgi:signal-transduction protein with cAMP-binding, CBS, and nucleotidyltransferase domain